MITPIESQANAKIKLLKKLQLKKYRQKLGQFVVENFKIIHDGASAQHLPEAIFVTHEWITQYPQDLDVLETLGVPVYAITSSMNTHFSSLETPSGIAAIYPIIEHKTNYQNSIVYLDHVMDPGNLGTIMRCACAFGFETVVLAGGVDVYNHKTISAAKDAIFKVAVCSDEDNSLFEKIKQKMPVVGATIDGDTDMTGLHHSPICIVLGSEAHGISPHLQSQLTQKIKISMSSEMESLNVATAAAIILHACYASRVGA
jgi:TrmH family RNA methyltransferase